MSQATNLYQLQEIDQHILRQRKRLHEIAAALSDHKVITEAQSRVTAARQTLAPLQSAARHIEFEIQSNNTKAQGAEDRLYSGTVKNPKELQDIQQEIASLKRRNSEIEDRLLEIMLEIEEAEAVLETAEGDLAAVQSAWDAEHEVLLAEQQQLEAELAGRQADRKQAAEQIPAEDLQIYRELQPRTSNLPLARLQGDSCAVCGVGQTSMAVQEVRQRRKYVKCSGCGRILVDL